MKFIRLIIVPVLMLPGLVMADDLAIDKVYHPYVQPLEREVEWRMVAADGDHLQRLGIGQSLNDRVFVEGYLLAVEEGDTFRLEGYELETRIQLTEQGEYPVDWGMLVELEKAHHQDEWELATALLMEKQWGRWVGAANFWLEYEWGNQIKDEFETAVALQTRYRLSPEFEPAIEFYGGENTRALGPVAMGDIRFGPGKKLHWETGILLGLSKKTPDATLRLLAEYEF
ncbi:hypothetical protein [Methylophaga sp. OBS1]|jgi:hypothetical protein|uniref:hypothetical protein n=1 Tax=Methylophaga sp. OBS1 TaxID=2991933 RepID=UPI00225B6C09|nr:hypothetical protein [Methylophaga sp. OBS1]MCX4191202.1 hypothetical protein [Methylophaga sp. OBS1]MCX4191852.1 hypothetical protein [Methylophaga sp. OBS1]